MANSSTTHVIEIEAGIGEPAFIPLSLGQELQPISVGKKGMWRLESPRVLDVHAFVYFDGTALFLQSADEENAASVEGSKIGKAWTELHAPCTIDVGQARLRFRSLIADADGHATAIATAPPVRAPGGPGMPAGSTRPGASMPVAVAPPRPPPRAAPREPAREDASPTSFPKPERPFKPGELSTSSEDESTRVAPLLDTTNGARISGIPVSRVSSTSEMPAPHGNSGMIQMQGPMAAPAPPSMPPPPLGFGPPPPSLPPQQPFSQPPQTQPAYSQPPQQPFFQPPYGFDPNAPTPYGMPYANGNASGPYGAMGPNGMPGPGVPAGTVSAAMMSGGYGALPPNGVHPQHLPPPSAGQDFLTKLKAQSVPKMVAAVLFAIGTIMYLVHDDDDGVPRPTARADAGAAVVATVAATAPMAPAAATPPVWPPGVPCPPPNWPAGTPWPCTPSAATAATTTVGADPAAPQRPATVAAVATAPVSTPGGKTLERQAVDYVAAGDLAKAAGAYEELVRREPNNRVYAEAARILRAKLDAGAN